MIRQATVQDLPNVAILWFLLSIDHRQQGLAYSEVNAPEWIASFERTLGKFSFLWVVEDNNPAIPITGFVLARIKQAPRYYGSAAVGEISDLYVSEDYRGQGIGSALARVAIDQLKERDLEHIEVRVMASNPAAEFWRRLGFADDFVQMRLTETNHTED
jgi:ribosomal protein S18 acetylase RimI-like enzyme